MVIPSSSRHTRRVAADKVHSIICNREQDGDEQYLVRWHTKHDTSFPPLSWHLVNELKKCLEHVQDYLEERETSRKLSLPTLALSRKRKGPDTGLEVARRPSPFDRQVQLGSRASSVSRSSLSSATPDIYNGVLDKNEKGFIYCQHATLPDIVSISITDILTPELKLAAHNSEVKTGNMLIRAEYVRRLKKVPGQPIKLINLHDAATPSLRFHYISHYVMRDGVEQLPPEFQEGCQSCSPHMGRSIGCEYTRKCDCLEYAAVDESRLNNEQRQYYERCQADTHLSTMGLPKKFPYFTEGLRIQRTGALVSFYLHSRHVIYECNDHCRCGPNCRNRNVQFGRKVELEIFKTGSGRGWGLRCTQDLYKGQFIDTYLGEVITDQEATRREKSSSKAKQSYLYTLDKFNSPGDLNGETSEAAYVVDGEFMGGPSKFMNHSCEPNCRQYTVSYNKHDRRIYDLAFFACRDIPAFEELTFDYLDKDEDDEVDPDPGEDATACLCGASKCRKWLWS